MQTRIRIASPLLGALLLASCAPVPPSRPDGGPRCGATVCGQGMVCCNESCGICTPPGGVCIQIACVDGGVPPPSESGRTP